MDKDGRSIIQYLTLIGSKAKE